jgi:stearoyl-CoA desaturase (delta-9 desaturase)
MFAITGFYHRYFSHRGYRVNSRVVQFLMGFWGCTAIQQGPLWWAAHHRWHHRHSDRETDLHSPVRHGFLFSHTLWFLTLKHHPEFQDERQWPKDLSRFPELVWLEKYSLLPPVLLAVVLFAVGGSAWLVWGFFVSTVFLWHGTFTINSLTHVWGKRRFETEDTSRNNIILALVTLGEGWHNNHHAFAGGAKAGFYWYEIDITYYLLRLMQALRLISDLGGPPPAVLELGRQNDALRREARRFLRAGVVRQLSHAELSDLVQAAACCVDRAVVRAMKTPELRAFIQRFRADRRPISA